eukprot:CAMPEP_0173146356 /NCGR_PEP_ID=MMETSP1105-20130129/8451_1 /TAXON_ID=2985 /ORGANISM="Ochromonas sp., Strain BG-1" /LENGTH=477 /DNA_ID=CAMNT_0014060555 /DNA_START=346 /DNA_END=1779 /DNA_ORIENTATION=+
MQDLLETFSEPIPDFTPLYLPHQGKYLAPPPHGLLAGYLDPRAFHSLDSGYGMIPYAATLHAIPPHMDPYSTPLAAIAAMDKQGNFLSLSEKFPPPSSIPVPKGPSTAAKERRRERNKVLARKTRLKKKAETETLRDQLVSLMVENEKLKDIIQNYLPPITATDLLTGDLQLPDNIVKLVHQMVSMEEKLNLSELTLKQRSFILVNPNANDSPIVYVSPGFMKLTGYSREECIGRNCRFLQGVDTDTVEVSKMKEALTKEEDFSVVLLNYHKDGTEFWNRIELQHLRDETGKVRFIVGVQTKCDFLSLRSRLARQRNTYNLRSRKGSAQQSADEMEEDDGISGDNLTVTTKQTASTGNHNSSNATSSTSLDTKVSKALDDNREYHLDKRIRLSMKFENEEKRYQKEDSDDPSTDTSQKNTSSSGKYTNDEAMINPDDENSHSMDQNDGMQEEREKDRGNASGGDGSTDGDEGADNPT